MKILSKLFQFYVFSNLHVSVSVACLVLVSGLLFQVNLELEAFFLASCTFVAYHFIRFLNRYKYGKKHVLDSFSNQHKNTLIVMTCFAIILAGYMFFNLKLTQVYRLFPLGILTLLYGCSFLRINNKKYSIRYLPGIKIFIIALVWAGAVVFFPLGFNSKAILFFIEIFLFVIALTLPFDIRDMLFDKGNVKTLPILLGVLKTKFLGILCLAISLAIHSYSFDTYYSYSITIVVLGLLLMYAKVKQSTYYSSFWIEGVPIFYLGILYLELNI